MPIVKEVAPEPVEHVCQRPDAQNHEYGSLFCCDWCHRVSVVKFTGAENVKWTHGWCLETNRERRKRWLRGEIYAGELR